MGLRNCSLRTVNAGRREMGLAAMDLNQLFWFPANQLFCIFNICSQNPFLYLKGTVLLSVSDFFLIFFSSK